MAKVTTVLATTKRNILLPLLNRNDPYSINPVVEGIKNNGKNTISFSAPNSNHFNGKFRVERSKNSINIPIKLPGIDNSNTS